MADKQKIETTTLGFRVPRTVKEDVNQFIEEQNLKPIEFIQKAMDALKSNLISEVDPQVESELTNLNYHLGRINQIFIEQIKKTEDEKNAHENQLQEQKEKHEQAVSDLVDQIRELKLALQERSESEEKIKAENEKLIKRNTELEEANRSAVSASALYEETITNLKQQVAELKDAGDRLKVAEGIIVEQKDTIVDLQNKIKELTERAQKEKDQLKLDQETKILELKNQHGEEMRKLQAEFTEKVNGLHNSYRGRLDAKDEKIDKLHSDYGRKIDSLSEQVEQYRQRAASLSNKLAEQAEKKTADTKLKK
jgi:chromosome segregation ATPase